MYTDQTHDSVRCAENDVSETKVAIYEILFDSAICGQTKISKALSFYECLHFYFRRYICKMEYNGQKQIAGLSTEGKDIRLFVSLPFRPSVRL